MYFPRLIAPLSLVASGLIKFLIQFALFLGLLIYFRFKQDNIHPNHWILLSPFLLALMAGMGLGFGIIFSSLTTKYRDLVFLISFGIQLAMYATPIIYPLSQTSHRMQSVLWWNPITHIVETFRYAFLGSGLASPAGIAYTTVFTICIVLLGVIIFNQTETTFMDTV